LCVIQNSIFVNVNTTIEVRAITKLIYTVDHITWRIRIVKLQTSLPVFCSSCTDRWPLIHVYATTLQSNSYQVYIWSNTPWSHSQSSNRLIWKLKWFWA
jgi:hypothetical protein